MTSRDAANETWDEEEYVCDFDGFSKRVLANPDDEGTNKISQEAFFYFCQDGKKDRVEFLLKHGVNVECRDKKEKTGLVLACGHGHTAIVELSMKQGADANAIDVDGKTGLMLACENGHEETVELLLKYVTDLDIVNFNGSTALMISCEHGHERIVDLLIKHKADVNKTGDKWKRTPLCFAAGSKSFHIVQSLLNHGACVDGLFLGKRTALMVAINNGSRDIVQLLLESGADVHITDELDGNALVQSCTVGDTEIMELLVKHGADVNYGGEDIYIPLMVACRVQQENALEFLLKNGADVNARHDDLENVLWYVCEHEGVNENMLEKIMSHGIDIHFRQDDGMTILMQACASRENALVKVLLKYGAEVNLQCNIGMTAAMHAADSGAHACLKMLTDAGANLDLSAENGRTVLSFAMQNYYDPELTLKFLLQERVLLKDGQLKMIHKNANYGDSCSKAVLTTMDLGCFEWEFCSTNCLESVGLAAIKSGISPGKITHGSKKVSPLVLAFLENKTDAIETFLKYLFYFPEDFTTLATDIEIRAEIPDSAFMKKITLQPMSLFTWSFLTVSKAVSMTGHSRESCQRIDELLLPDTVKKRLKYQLD